MHAPASSDPPHPIPLRRYRRFMRIVAWFYAGSTIFLLLLAATTAFLLNSTRFHNYVIRTAEQQAQESLGVRVQLQNFAISLSNLRLDVYGVTVDGASPHSNPPLLQVQHAEASLRIVSILRKKWYLDDIRVDQPVVQVYIDKDGHSNIPTIKSSNSNSNTSIFDLGIRHAVLDRGEIFYNDRPTPLAVDLHNVDFHSVFNEALKQYTGKLAYADGRLSYGASSPLRTISKPSSMPRLPRFISARQRFPAARHKSSFPPRPTITAPIPSFRRNMTSPRTARSWPGCSTIRRYLQAWSGLPDPLNTSPSPINRRFRPLSSTAT